MRIVICALMAAFSLVISSAPAAHADVSTTPAHTAGLGGDAVYDLAVLGSGRVILGGRFTSVGAYPRSNLGAILPNGDADPSFAPTTNGTVLAVAASADGSRVFIGGTFTMVNGVPRQNLAALDAVTGALIGGWEADTTGGTPEVTSLAVSGSTLFVGGRFSTIDGAAKQKLAAIDVSSGNLVHWSTWVNGGITEVRVSADGGTVWVTGEFTKIRGIARPRLGGIDRVTGQPTSFVATGNDSRPVTLAVTSDGWLYVGNDNNRLLAYQPAVSSAPRWLRALDGNVQAIAAAGTTLYIGGHFKHFSGDDTLRTYFASVDRFTGATHPWDVDATGAFRGCWALVINGNHLHAGGGFTYFADVKQRLYARFDGTP